MMTGAIFVQVAKIVSVFARKKFLIVGHYTDFCIKSRLKFFLAVMIQQRCSVCDG